MTHTKTKILVSGVGGDQLLALRLVLQSSSAELSGITVRGDDHQAAQQAAQLLETYGVAALPIATGEKKALLSAQRLELTDPKAGITASELIVSQANQHTGKLHLVVLGPLTDLVKALAIDPDLPHKLAGVIVMGGAIRVPGDVTAVAEANIYSDPEAAAFVLASELPLTLVPLDVTQKVALPMGQDYVEGLDACTAVLAVIEPETLQKTKMKLTVDCQSVLSRGAVLADLRAIPRIGSDVEVCVDVDGQRVVQHIREVLEAGGVQ
ncbi:nucleoside hydrolase [Brevibacillus ruminantium]|uniref:Nucleoside hydrolase n=1 Tax=Brevibacillus ruminantium TaxID=2950604 RepID=A0ABY4WEV9_9BACL|nr:nucleoside hydrolase [Brevibacillus ruminantium]USG64330.1 nucleoside hydrolase [Brevibacillus ruminantium]